MKMIKVEKIISQHKQHKSEGQYEVIVRLEDKTLATRHLYASQFPKEGKS